MDADTIRYAVLLLLGLVMGLKLMFLWGLWATRRLVSLSRWWWPLRAAFITSHALVYLGLALSISERVNSGVPLQIGPLVLYVTSCVLTAGLLGVGIRDLRRAYWTSRDLQNANIFDPRSQ
jgi:hypothetical protein